MSKSCILSVSGVALTPEEAALFADQQPWAVILMGRSCESRDQVRALVDNIWNALGRACLIFIDQEGGRVARLRGPDWPRFPAGQNYAEIYAANQERGLRATWLGHRLIAAELSAMAIHANCAPVVDLPVDGAHDIIGDRALGREPAVVAELAKAALKGMADGGVVGVIKHIPGHGRARADSHEELPVVIESTNELTKDFDAFSRVADAPMAMTAHIAYNSIDPGVAATVSPTLIKNVIRKQIGFDGLLMTDDLGMKALGGTLTDRASASIAAGCDVLLHCSGFIKDPAEILSEMTEVANAAPELTGRPLERAQHAEHMATLAETFDVAQGWEEFYQFFPQLGAAA